MSDSDDTDVLLLIPPDLFIVASSSGSDIGSGISGQDNYQCERSGVISELVGHIQSLESRIIAIESKDNSLDTSLLNTSSDSQALLIRNHNNISSQVRPMLTSSLPNTPKKPHTISSVLSTPNGFISSNRTNLTQNDTKPIAASVNANIDTIHSKHDPLISHSDLSVSLGVLPNQKGSHACATSPKQESSSLSLDCYAYKDRHKKSENKSNSNSFSWTVEKQLSHSKNIQNMELSEINELLQEMETTESELSRKMTCGNPLLYNQEQSNVPDNQEDSSYRNSFAHRKLDFYLSDKETRSDTLSLCHKDFSQFDGTDKLISEFKTWEHNPFPFKSVTEQDDQIGMKHSYEGSSLDTMSKINCSRNTEFPTSTYNTNLIHKNSEQNSTNGGLASKPLVETHIEPVFPQHFETIPNLCGEKCDLIPIRSSVHPSINTEQPCYRKNQKFLSLSDFWDTNISRSQEETLKIKVEEERFRREHCEHLIQELQKRLLEQQEKVAVAVRVDNEKNILIAQFQNTCTKIKQRVKLLEGEYQKLQLNLKSETEKHQSEVIELRGQIKRLEGELSKALDLAAGYKTKCDSTVEEKVDLLKSHADELENYKSLVQEAENRCEQMKKEYNKLFEKNQQTEESLKNAQQELNRERLRGGEVRNEMSVIHKALDACEAELTILRQEKESLQLKLREEINRHTILENKLASYHESTSDAKKAEMIAKDEVKTLSEQHEKIRKELQEVYQNQVDEVVKKKLQEFQNQLDSAESEFLEELKTRQQVIAESAARKVKDVIDKHQLEIKLLEEKHREEKRLYELQLAQAMEKSFFLESQLNSQRTNKSQLAEQLHCVMQKQWQQALRIISGGNVENLISSQRINMDQFMNTRGPRKSESMPNCCSKISMDSIKLPQQLSNKHNLSDIHLYHDKHGSTMTLNSNDETPVSSTKESRNDLRKYIRMVSDMQEARQEFSKIQEPCSSPTSNPREIPRKHYVKKELSISEDSIAWQPISETSAHDISEYIPIPQKLTNKSELKNKPPWK